ncbi:MAG: hypothetical protein IIZ38_18755 [Sphingomonas sp.]|uniref:hypothetical protein n=1 Tax=Sphingomonas sp. TaxID=28214 RepID=UPI0025F91CE8|nr:hypothetical protein [Sphingomonas sp.]MBQ1500353.1 hypothetical protein [Sphingomonas sp.]MBQ8104243.1 hypothetical protein [Afipia sp.]
MFAMSFFEDDEGNQAAIFAETHWRASEIWEAIGERFQLMPKGWLGSEIDCWWSFGRVSHEYDARVRCIEGIGVYRYSGWKILPLNYEAIGLGPPSQGCS